MNWLNLNVTTLDSEEFLGASPVERATWLCLLRYCAGQENGGRIEGAREWKDRKWQQVVRITGEEVNSECELWRWDGGDLVVEFYPHDKENEVKTNRANGSRGGRPRRPAHKTPEKPIQNHPVPSGLTETETPSETDRFEIAETERKGKEGEREGNGNVTSLPPRQMRESRNIVMDALKARVNGLRESWGKPARWNYAEDQHLFGGAAAQMEELTEEDWTLLKDFLNAFLPDAKAYWQPHTRAKFCETFPNVWESAQRWQSKSGNGPLPKKGGGKW